MDDVSAVFTSFIHGESSNVVVRGDTSSPSVEWLATGLKSLSIETVLPSRGVLEVITSINLHELTLDFTPATAYAPKSSSKDTTAAFQLPFGFPLDIVAVQQVNNFTTRSLGRTAELVSGHSRRLWWQR